MLLGDLTTLNPIEANFIVERSAQTAYPRASFQYANYETDPRPDVLVLGRYKAGTGNTLIGGVNLNYLSNAQQERLRGQLKRIYSRGKLRSRYRALKKLLPDVAQYYRTYNPEHAKGVEMDTFLSQSTKLDKKTGKVQPVEKPKKVKDPAQSAWQLKRRLYDPDTGYRTKPEYNRDDPETTKEKRRRYRSQRKQLDDLEYQAALDRAEDESSELPTGPENVEPDDINLELDKFSSIIDDEPEPEPEPLVVDPEPEEAKEESRDYHYIPNMGYVWSDSNSYIAWHQLPRFTSLHESSGRTLVVQDLISEQTIVDKAFDHSVMLTEAGWDYDHTVRYEVVDGNLRIQCNSDDVDLQQILEAFVRSDYYELLVANNQN